LLSKQRSDEENQMTDRMQYAESDPRHHTLKIKDMLNEAMRHMREDAAKVSDPKSAGIVRNVSGSVAWLDHCLRSL
jgi:hypothetical protein